MELYYIELEHGCAIKAAESFDDAWRIAAAAADDENRVESVAIATQTDIDWVKSMGGHIPNIR